MCKLQYCLTRIWVGFGCLKLGQCHIQVLAGQLFSTGLGFAGVENGDSFSYLLFGKRLLRVDRAQPLRVRGRAPL